MLENSSFSSDILVSGLNLSMGSAARNIGERLFVRCKDDGGSSVEWKGPKGRLGMKTRPKVQISSYGTGLIFDSIKKDDFGEYTCSVSGAPYIKDTFTLTEVVAEKKSPHKPQSTENIHIITSTEETNIFSSNEEEIDTFKNSYNENLPTDDEETNIVSSGEEEIDTFKNSYNENLPTDDEETNIVSSGEEEIDIFKNSYNENLPTDDEDTNEIASTTTETYNISIGTTLAESDIDSESTETVPTDDDTVQGTPEKPKITWEFVDTAEEQSANEGDDRAVIRCLTDRKDISITWFLNGTEPLTGKKYMTIADGLLIFNITRNDSNIYECQGLHTKSGVRHSRHIKFIVKHKPYSVYAQDLPVYAYLDQKINLTCEVEAVPPPEFEWVFNKSTKNYGRIRTISNHISVLELVMKKETQARYQCIARNKFGESKKIFDVYLGVQPDPPLDVQLLDTSSDTFRLKIDLPEESNSTQNNTMVPRWLVVFYKIQNNTDWHDQEFDINSYPSVTVDVIGLQNSTKYEIRVATRNLAGLSDYTNSTFFETSSSSSVCIQVKSIFLYILIGYLISLTQNLRLA